MPPTNMPADPSISWMLGALVLVVGGLLAYVVRSLVDKIGPAMERLTAAIERIPGAVAEAIKESERTRV